MKDTIKDFILSVGAGNTSSALDSFNDIMRDKTMSAIEDKKVDIAGKMFKSEATELDEAIKFNTNDYENEHSKKPSGKGTWGFKCDNKDEIKTSPNMTFKDAKKWAKEQFPNATTIYVLG